MRWTENLLSLALVVFLFFFSVYILWVLLSVWDVVYGYLIVYRPFLSFV